VGYDTSPEAKAALDTAAESARHVGATLRLISVVSPINYGYNGVWMVAADPELVSVRREQCERQLQEALEPLGQKSRAEGRVIDGDPVKVLVEEAGKGIDLLFVGSRGYGRLRGVLLGSVSAEVIASAPCPVVVVPRGVDDPSDRGHASR
jgi:nucleotide-binding universal stress UspA family protein